MSEIRGFSEWNVQDYLGTPEQRAAFVNAAMEESDDPEYLKKVLGEVARAEGMGKIAESAGVTREGLYRSLREDGNPSFSTVVKVLGSLGLRLEVRPM